VARGDQHSELSLDSDFDEGPEHLRLPSLLFVAVGGLLGTIARYGLSHLIRSGGDGWPIATLVTNLSGALLLGTLLEALARTGGREEAGRRLRLLGGVGFCGAFTTYSTLAVDITGFLRHSRPALAVAYAGTTVVAGFVVTMFGVALASRLRAPR